MTAVTIRFLTAAGTHRTAPAQLIRLGPAGSALVHVDGRDRWVPLHWVIKEKRS